MMVWLRKRRDEPLKETQVGLMSPSLLLRGMQKQKPFKNSLLYKYKSEEMALIVKDTLIRKRDGALPAGSSGFFVSVPSVFLFGLADGDKIIGKIKIKEGE